MNFQSLLKINAAKQKAEVYQNVGDEVTKIIKELIYNKNMNLDKNVLIPDKSKPKLNIYIANDYGFCGNFNATVRQKIREHTEDFKIIIGKKIPYNDDKTLLKIDKDEFKKRIGEIEKIIDDGLRDMSYSEINLYYVHYYSYTEFGFKQIQLFPIEFDGKYYEGHDYVSETKVDEMLKGLISFYISYQVQIAEEISVASENVLRKQITDMALDRIKEVNSEKAHKERKEKLSKSILKTVENYKRNMEENYE